MSGTLTFKGGKLRHVLYLLQQHKTEDAQPNFVQRYEKPDWTPEKGLWLVGDQGVYLMSNAHPKDEIAGDSVCYAEGCNPDKDDFDTWWANKNRIFGGDDGVEFISMRDLPLTRGIEEIKVHMTPKTFKVTFKTRYKKEVANA